MLNVFLHPKLQATRIIFVIKYEYMNKNILLTTIGIFLMIFTFAQPGSITLTKGQKFSVENKINAISSQELMGQTMESKAEFNTLSTIEVKEVKDNNYNIINNILHMKANMSAMGQEMGFDSDKKEDMEAGKGPDLKKIINHPKEVIMDKTGKVISAKEDETNKEPADMSGMMMKQLLGDPNDGAFGLSIIFHLLPKNASPGFTWTDSSSQAGIKKITTYTLKEVKGSDVLVTFSGTMETDTQSSMQGIEISTKTKGNLKGEETVDIVSGILKTRSSILETNGTVSAQGMEIPMTSKITSQVSVKGS